MTDQELLDAIAQLGDDLVVLMRDYHAAPQEEFPVTAKTAAEFRRLLDPKTPVWPGFIRPDGTPDPRECTCCAPVLYGSKGKFSF
jgi:hypothetical protein